MSFGDRLTLLVDRLLRSGAPSAALTVGDRVDAGAGAIRTQPRDVVPRSPPRPTGDGPVWFLCGDENEAKRLGAVLSQVGDELGHECQVTVSAREPPAEQAEQALARLDPAAVVIIGFPWRPATVQAAARRGVPILGAGLTLPCGHWMERPVARPLARRVLGRFDALLCQDSRSASLLRRCGAPRGRISIAGAMTQAIPVAPANESDRAALAQVITPRPVWCAIDLPAGELDLLVRAQRLAIQRLHRLLLVVVPQDPSRGPQLRDRLSAEGWTVALRSDGEEPTDDVTIYIADLPDETGLWLRLAPIAFIGGTLTPGAAGSPMQAAALGSAVLHGPELGGHAAAFAGLAAAGGARQAGNAAEMALAVEILAAPEQAAAMAHAAWEVCTAGDAAAARLVAALSAALDRPGTAAA